MPDVTTPNFEKVLWKTQPHPDNYIPHNFLSSLRKNPNFKPYTYWSLVSLSCAVTQHLSTICIFISVFIYLKEQLLDPRTLIWLSVGCFVVGYTLWVLLDPTHVASRERVNSFLKTFKSSILIFLALMSLSPVLRTLTASTSSDSIWALSAILLLLNAILADYSVLNVQRQLTGRLTSVLSMNAAVSASAVLASRLTTDIAVFGLMLFAIQLFAVFPFLRYRFQVIFTCALGLTVKILLTSGLAVSAIWFTAMLSWKVTCLYTLIFFFVTFLAPALLMWAQKYKNELRGPWDVAVPRVD
ncbi:phosphatidylinositol N-acetylglucosaminyltransferase subunit C [Amanita rubescens]|nr:phosphatidylinositol N-acetylglucosaminyltransferase subunit C [Amanita rubescens]